MIAVHNMLDSTKDHYQAEHNALMENVGPLDVKIATMDSTIDYIRSQPECKAL